MVEVPREHSASWCIVEVGGAANSDWIGEYIAILYNRPMVHSSGIGGYNTMVFSGEGARLQAISNGSFSNGGDEHCPMVHSGGKDDYCPLQCTIYSAIVNTLQWNTLGTRFKRMRYVYMVTGGN